MSVLNFVFDNLKYKIMYKKLTHPNILKTFRLKFPQKCFIILSLNKYKQAKLDNIKDWSKRNSPQGRSLL